MINKLNKHKCDPVQPPFPIMCDSCPFPAICKCKHTGMWMCEKHWRKHRNALELPLLGKKAKLAENENANSI